MKGTRERVTEKWMGELWSLSHSNYDAIVPPPPPPGTVMIRGKGEEEKRRMGN